jgi:hypothetical protein
MLDQPTNELAKSAMVCPTSVWKHSKFSTTKLGVTWNFVVHNFWGGLSFLWKG